MHALGHQGQDRPESSICGLIYTQILISCVMRSALVNYAQTHTDGSGHTPPTSRGAFTGLARLSRKSCTHDKQTQRNTVVLTRQSSSVKPVVVLLNAAGNGTLVGPRRPRGRTSSVQGKHPFYIRIQEIIRVCNENTFYLLGRRANFLTVSSKGMLNLTE